MNAPSQLPTHSSFFALSFVSLRPQPDFSPLLNASSFMTLGEELATLFLVGLFWKMRKKL